MKPGNELHAAGEPRVGHPCSIAHYAGSDHSVTYTWERAARWSTQLSREC